MIDTIFVSTFIIAILYTCEGFAKSPPLPVSEQFSMKSKSNEVTDSRRPWDLGRFLNTVNFYGALNPFNRFFPKSLGTARSLQRGQTIWSAEENNLAIEWGPLDDVVMGGASESKISLGTSFKGKWVGFVTSANNGGFAGIRTRQIEPRLDLSRCKGVVIKVVGDGQRYKFIVRDESEWNGIAWSTSFDTKKDKTTEVKMLFADLKPTKFAKVINVNKPFDSSSVSAIQLTLSKFEYDGGLNKSFKEGPFKLSIESIQTL